MKRKTTTSKQEHGFTIIQMVSTMAIVAVVSTVGVLGIRKARAEFRLQNSARVFASYIEKARADSVRRHAGTGAEASVEMFGAATNTYAVTMDFGTGVVQTRTFQLEPGVDFFTDPLKVTFDWRGRLTVPCAVTKSCVFQVRSEVAGYSIPVDVSGSGDITVDAQHFPDGLIPDVNIAEVTNDDVVPDPSGTPNVDPPSGGGSGDGVDPVDSPTPSPSPTATPNNNGNGNGPGGNNGNGNGNGNATPTPTPTVTPTPSPGGTATPTPSPVAQCSSSISPSTITISQSDATKKTGTATFTIANGTGTRTITAAQDGNGNSLVTALSLVRIDGSGSTTVSVTAKNGAGNRGQFSLKVSTDPSCGSTQVLTVIVNN